jgi:hypothetical protein
VLPLAATLVDNDVFVALVEGFAALGSIIAFYSSLLAFLSLIYRNADEDIGKAVNYGIAVGFIPGAVVGVAVFLSAANNVP